MDRSRVHRRRHRSGVGGRYEKPYPPIGKKYIALLEALRHSDKNQRLALLRSADEKLIKYICECALNVLKGVMTIKETQKQKLKKYKTTLRKLLKKPAHKNSWKGKKRYLVQKGGSFLPFLLTPILEIFSNIL